MLALAYHFMQWTVISFCANFYLDFYDEYADCLYHEDSIIS